MNDSPYITNPKEPNCKKHERRKGFSLIEVLVSVTVLAMVAGGISSVSLITSRIAYSNIYENTAYNIAQAYAEQIKTINSNVIKNALKNPDEQDIPTESLMLGIHQTTENLRQSDPLKFGVWLEKEIIVDIEEKEDGSFRERRMKMRVLPTGRDLREETADWDAVEIVLDFEWEVIDGTGVNLHSGQIKLVKSSIGES